MANLTVFTNDGLEIVIDTDTGEAFATQAGYVRMSGRPQSTISSRMTGTINEEKCGVQSAEILTSTGLRTHRLIPAKIVYQWLKGDNPELADKMAEAGATLYLHRLAGYKSKIRLNHLLKHLD